MKFPKFWLKQSKAKFVDISVLFAPLSLLWKFFSYLSTLFGKNEIMPIPVVCVGNITLGGNGKTPTVIKFFQLLRNLGYNPHIVSRGYKSKLKGPLLVCSQTNSHIEVGDEPLMLATYGPTWVSRERSLGIKSAAKANADIVILDDGFQNNSVFKDFSFVVVDTSVGFGNEKIIPAGPLREPINVGLQRADMIIAIGSKSEQEAFGAKIKIFTNTELVHGKLVPSSSNFDIRNKKVICFAGIAHPKKFFHFVESLGAKVLKTYSFPNHKPLKEKTLKRLAAEAKKNGAFLVTTEKDFVRIPLQYKELIKEIKVELTLDNTDLIYEKLKQFKKSVE